MAGTKISTNAGTRIFVEAAVEGITQTTNTISETSTVVIT